MFFYFHPDPGENDENGRAYFLKLVGEQPPTRSDLNFRKPRERTIGVSLNGAISKTHPKMIIFTRKTHGCWVPPF